MSTWPISIGESVETSPIIVINCYNWYSWINVGNRDILVCKVTVKIENIMSARHHRCVKRSLGNGFLQGCTMYTSCGPKMSLHDVSVFWGDFPINRGGFCLIWWDLNLTITVTLWCGLGSATRINMKWLTLTLYDNLLHFSCLLDWVWQVIKLLGILR